MGKNIMNNRGLFFFVSFTLATAASAQVSRLDQGIDYKAEAQMVGATGDVSPIWMTANRHGLSSTANSSGYLRAGLERKIENDSAYHWKVGYGVDLAVPFEYTSHFVIQQLYAEGQYKKFRLGIGSKERTQEFKNDRLSLGGMTTSINARPIPQLRAEVADWWNISGHSHLVAIKGHLAYGKMTDGDWQERFVGGEESNRLFAKNVLYHNKAGYLRVGDERRFPLTATLGLEMTAMFSGEIWNVVNRGGADDEGFDSHQQLSHGFSDFMNALIPGGSDANDGVFTNVAGNQLGSWHISIDWNTPSWGIRGYVDHFFEDHSQLFVQYGWKDNLLGLELRLPKNRFVSEMVYEHLATDDQSGSVYHDATNELPLQISGKDTYYNHHLYGAYHHWGQVIGNPMLLSPIYNDPHVILLYNNRVRANHFAMTGNPTDEISWRLLLTQHHTLGSYDLYINDARSFFCLAEVNYSPRRLAGWQFSLGYGCNTGDLLGDSHGFEAHIRKSGIIKRRK